MLRVVSVSLGSSSRDKSSRANFLGEEVELVRKGTDGDFPEAMRLIAELDGEVDAIGLGGIDLWLCARRKRWMIRDAKRLADQARTTPVADGSGLKLTLERQMVDWLSENFSERPMQGSKALVVSAVDRWGMAEGISQYCDEVIYGDLIFALDIPIPLRRLQAVYNFACVVAPVITRLPFQLIYPTGDKQKEHKPKHSELFNWADWICGDFHYIRRNIPPRLDGKVILTNTTTAEDEALLKERGLGWLITTTPVIEGRSFGMNVLESCLMALIRKQGDIISPESYEVYLNKLDLKPSIRQLN
ncbi:MAG: quinate 5-dehydrogenase [bacterium]